ncbi:MAG: hypothetical protein KTR31_00110 [Myxococcales bacterium]|nr:hypothetical protein [Myxococcales bacterium]
MARRGKGLGESTADRLMSRMGSGLHRRSMEDGGEVFMGRMVDRAMRAMGGDMRGFALHGSVFMPSSFDASDPADQATYAHERLHASEGDGRGVGRMGRNPDAEEAQARDLEQMVLHNLQSGQDFISAMETARDQAQASTGGGGGTEPQVTDEDVLKAGYQALRGQGLTHEQVVTRLRDDVLRRLEERREGMSYRSATPSVG